MVTEPIFLFLAHILSILPNFQLKMRKYEQSHPFPVQLFTFYRQLNPNLTNFRFRIKKFLYFFQLSQKNSKNFPKNPENFLTNPLFYDTIQSLQTNHLLFVHSTPPLIYWLRINLWLILNLGARVFLHVGAPGAGGQLSNGEAKVHRNCPCATLTECTQDNNNASPQ